MRSFVYAMVMLLIPTIQVWGQSSVEEFQDRIKYGSGSGIDYRPVILPDLGIGKPVQMYHARVVQVVDDGLIIVQLAEQETQRWTNMTVAVKCSTEGLVDGAQFDWLSHTKRKEVKIVGTRSFKTTQGGRWTMYLAEISDEDAKGDRPLSIKKREVSTFPRK